MLLMSEALQMCPIHARDLFRFVFVDLWVTHRNLISVKSILWQATFVKPNELAECIYSDGTQGIPNNLANCCSSSNYNIGITITMWLKWILGSVSDALIFWAKRMPHLPWYLN